MTSESEQARFELDAQSSNFVPNLDFIIQLDPYMVRIRLDEFIRLFPCPFKPGRTINKVNNTSKSKQRFVSKV